MKVCAVCGNEIGTRDGENLCNECDHLQNTEDMTKRKSKNNRRCEREAVLKSLGLVKVRGAMGGTYWE